MPKFLWRLEAGLLVNLASPEITRLWGEKTHLDSRFWQIQSMATVSGCVTKQTIMEEHEVKGSHSPHG